jgi:type II secretory pathway pseudopilin PulG
MVVIGIIVLFSLVSLPLIAQYQKTSKLKNEAQVLVTNLRLAQQLAVTEQVIYQLKLFPGTKSYQIINSSSNAVIKTVNLDNEVSISNISGLTSDAVQYTATGSAIETGVIILINSKNEQQILQIKPSGYVQLN